MAEKHSKKKLTTWVCNFGCDITRNTCKHIEAAIAPDVGNGTMSMKLRQDIETDKITEDPIIDQLEYEAQYRRLEKSLAKMGIESFRAELLMDRYVDRLSLAEIAKNRGYLNHNEVNRLVKDTLVKLRAIGSPIITRLLKEYS